METNGVRLTLIRRLHQSGLGFDSVRVRRIAFVLLVHHNVPFTWRNGNYNDEFQQQFNTTIAGASSLLIAHANSQPHRGGSVVGRQYKNREERYALLMKDYFIPRSTFSAVDFRRRFRMTKELFNHILHDVVTSDSYFLQKKDGLGRLGLSPEQKLTNVFRMLAYRCSADSTDEYTRLGESTTLECLEKFCATIERIYRKDVERAFGILQARWAIVRGPTRLWCKQNLSSIMMTCIILHNMIVEDEYVELEEDSDEEDGNPRSSMRVRTTDYELEPTITYEIQHETQTIIDYMTRHNRIRATNVHHALRNDLINHLWRIERERQMTTNNVVEYDLN